MILKIKVKFLKAKLFTYRDIKRIQSIIAECKFGAESKKFKIRLLQTICHLHNCVHLPRGGWRSFQADLKMVIDAHCELKGENGTF